MSRILYVLFALLFIGGVRVQSLEAADLPKPTGPVLLTVTGNIAVKNDAKGALFDREMLMSLGMSTIKTTIPWVEGIVTYEGPSGKALLERLGVTSGTLKAFALNDYTAEIPVSDFLSLGAILAMKANAEEMTVRTKGPLFIVYPFDDQPSLKNDAIYARSVWQLKEIHVQ